MNAHLDSCIDYPWYRLDGFAIAVIDPGHEFVLRELGARPVIEPEELMLIREWNAGETTEESRTKEMDHA